MQDKSSNYVRSIYMIIGFQTSIVWTFISIKLPSPEPLRQNVPRPRPRPVKRWMREGNTPSSHQKAGEPNIVAPKSSWLFVDKLYIRIVCLKTSNMNGTHKCLLSKPEVRCAASRWWEQVQTMTRQLMSFQCRKYLVQKWLGRKFGAKSPVQKVPVQKVQKVWCKRSVWCKSPGVKGPFGVKSPHWRVLTRVNFSRPE